MAFRPTSALLLAAALTTVDAFTPTSPSLTLPLMSSCLHNRRNAVRLDSSTVSRDETSTTAVPTVNGSSAPDVLVNGNEPTSWQCDEDAVCVEIPACDDETCRTSLDVRLHGKWYDLTGWRKAHPAGTHWIDWYDGRDATEVMDAFHSEKAQNMYQRLPASKPDVVDLLSETVAPDTDIQIAFRNLRTELQADGWWERDYGQEFAILAIWASLVVSAAALAHTVAPVATILLGLSMTAAGWLGHDYIHGVDPYTDKLRNFAAVAAGLAPTWWSDKHNKHHALTNEMGVDEDIATDPFLYTWAPDPSQDSPFRRIQHWIFFVPFSFMFALWRVDTMKVAIQAVEQKRPEAKKELYCLLAHYAVLFSVFPVAVWLPAIFLSGLLSALIVTPTHQSEELFEDYQPDWVTAQFQSTRNAVTTNPFSEWIWGGMQYQLEHHLFPSMPRSKYPKLRAILQQFAKDNNVPGGYRETDEFDILYMNWDQYRTVAALPAVVGAPHTRGHPGQLGAISESTSPGARKP